MEIVRNFRFPLFIVIILTLLLTSSCQKNWELFQLLQDGTSSKDTIDTKEVKNCGFGGGKQSFTCTAGTDKSLSIGGSVDLSLNNGQFSISPEVSAQWGFTKSKEVTQDLEMPQAGFIYKYTLKTVYEVKTGKALFRSKNSKDETEANFAFDATCSIELVGRDTLKCPNYVPAGNNSSQPNGDEQATEPIAAEQPKPTMPKPQPQNPGQPSPPLPGPEVVSTVDGMTMVKVPAGEFLMGSSKQDAYARIDEFPQHTVYLDEYLIDLTEVTNAMFRRFVEVTGYSTQAERLGKGFAYNSSNGNWEMIKKANWQQPQGKSSSIDGLGDHPVVQVSWEDARAYCDWARRRLPTEAEWEKASRGTDGRLFPWGNQLSGASVNFCDTNCPFEWADRSVNDGYQFTSPVGSIRSDISPYGVLDLAGNVFEWTADWFSTEYYQNSPSSNPVGPSNGERRAVRGGGWTAPMDDMRSASRWHSLDPNTTGDSIGFRCALTP